MSSGNASYRCSMSSSADFSDEEDLSQRSGTVSPAPGDTLPWNLPKHERSKRKIQGGSVLDPAERAVLRIAGPTPGSCDVEGRKINFSHCFVKRLVLAQFIVLVEVFLIVCCDLV
ncbi:hypothetical protein AV530_005790 [Patagioenas fasciata monilis]|uniref:Microtubule-actin cross-linking factor 1 n=1 Tax=Patagioenas fasciata monilis TaxID=372326 RepID=A0A1V4JMK9_PATFA|nr:hypothetical protein AV530_005790 [Patagioenas fasciata monilis]